MKNLLFKILFILPLVAFGQYDFDSRYFTINATSLPEAPQFNSSDIFSPLSSITSEAKPGTFTLYRIPTFDATLKSYRINTSNYWMPVDMMGAVSTTTNYVPTSLKTEPKEIRGLRFSVYSTNGPSSRVTNTVYTEVRGLDLLSPCPPHGICPRCAPYRSNRGF